VGLKFPDFFWSKTMARKLTPLLHVIELSERLRDADLATIARANNLTYNTIKNVARGKDVRYKTLRLLSEYFYKLDSNPAQ
jgi:hypothetical protein